MPVYRGVDQISIIHSLRRGLAYLRAENLGPATVQWLAEWERGRPFEKLAVTTDNVSFSHAMHATRTDLLFSCMSAIFATAAAIEAQARRFGPACDLYRDLMRWGAFSSQNQNDNENSLQTEILFHVITSCLDHLKKDDEFEGQSKTADISFADDVSVDEIISLFSSLRSMGCEAAIGEIITENSEVASCAYDALYDMSGLKTAEKNLAIQSPLRRHFMLMAYSGDWSDARFYSGAMAAELMSLTRSFQGEASIEITGVSEPSKKRCGVAFAATAEFAQFVANKFPAYTVLSPDGDLIRPSPGGPILPGPQ